MVNFGDGLWHWVNHNAGNSGGIFYEIWCIFWPDIIHVMGDRIHNMIVFGVAERRQAPQKLPSSYLSVRNVMTIIIIIIIIITIIKWTFRY